MDTKNIGLRNIEVADTKISYIDGQKGKLIYRGYDILDLTKNSNFEETCFLLLHDELPTKNEHNNFKTELIDANKINCQTLTLRPWLPGDRFHPFGMAGTKKISDYLIDEKVDLYTKGNQWVLVDGEKIIWVCGRRINDEVKITDKTTDYAKLIFKQ